jgi:hypothetical protein
MAGLLSPKHENGLRPQVKVTKPVSFKVQRLCACTLRCSRFGPLMGELLKTKNVAESCPEPPFILREHQDERRVEGDDRGIVAVKRSPYFLAIL